MPSIRSAAPGRGHCCWRVSLLRSPQPWLQRYCTRPARRRYRIARLLQRQASAASFNRRPGTLCGNAVGVHREVTPSAVAMSFAGIAFHTEGRNARELARRIEPLAKFFQDAEKRVRAMRAPASLSVAHEQYVIAMALYAKAAHEMLTFTKMASRGISPMRIRWA